MKTDRLRWRLNDPGIEWRVRWTKVHRVSFHSADLTVCHIIIPDLPHDSERNDEIPTTAVECKTCNRVGCD